MNKIEHLKCGRFYGFSLAEALVTLLIISMIALASMPVITKRHRQITANGMWICTKNSAGELVSWSRSDSPADTFTNPDAWDKGCTFAAPSNARNVSVSVIGAGGGGASGQSYLELEAETPTSGTFTPSESAYYRIVVVGAGGGGGGGRNANGFKASGGGGASGTSFIGDVKLTKNVTYTLSAGKGGNGLGSKGGNCERKYGTADKGGDSAFFSTSDSGASLNIVAQGGNGGDRATTSGGGGFGICKNNCGGGNAGNNNSKNKLRKVTINNTTVLEGSSTRKQPGSTVNGVNIVYAFLGNSGQEGGCGGIYYNRTNPGGSGFDGRVYSIESSRSIGAGTGGTGSNYRNSPAYSSGTNGYVGIYKIHRVQGQGGEAALSKDKTFPNLRGKIVVDIADRAGSDTNGGTSVFELYDSQGRKIRALSGIGGKKGVGKETDYPADGENSYFSLDGGGKAAPQTCYQSGSTPVYGTLMQAASTVCERLECTINSDFGLPSGWKIERSFPFGKVGSREVPLNTNIWEKNTKVTPAALSNYFLNNDLKYYMYNFFPAAEDLQKIADSFNSYFVYNDEDLQSFTNYDGDVTVSGTVYKTLKDRGYCFRDTVNRLEYELGCSTTKKIVSGTYATVKVGEITNYKCTDGGDAMSHAFGAGGGGGFAMEKPGFSSKGGRGAQGAVIIEW